MQKPGVELAVIAAAPLTINLLRALGEADGDTACEKGRVLLDRIPFGHELFGLALAGFWLHVAKPGRPRE